MYIGIGDKYGRNMGMDVYHPEFRQSVAIDTRIQAVTRALGYSFRSYDEHEQFYQHIAKEAGLEAWELDRALFYFKDTLLQRAGLVSRSASARKRKKRVDLEEDDGRTLAQDSHGGNSWARGVAHLAWAT